MPPVRARIPWSELAALAAAWVALVASNTSAQRPTIETAVVALFALTAALLPRRARRSPLGSSIEATRIVGALSAIAIATTVTGPHPSTPTLALVELFTLSEILGLSAALAFASPLRLSTLRRAIAPGLVIALTTGVGLWPRAIAWFSPLRALPALSAWATVLFFVHGTQRPDPPADRARLVAPGLGAALVAAALTLRLLLPNQLSPLALASSLVALVAGLTHASNPESLSDTGPLARRAASAAICFSLSSLTFALLPSLPLASVLVGLAAMVLFLPSIDKRLRPDDGRLLSACDDIERRLPRAETLSDLAMAVLDPLRAAARDLRAPAALWVLDRPRVFRVDVAGTPSINALTLSSAKPLLSWLRARPAPVFIDTLSPHLVRRPELRAVWSCLDAHDALGALPLRDDGELVGVVIIPRGLRRLSPSYEEESRLVTVSHLIEGTLARLASLERAQLRVAASNDRAALDREARERTELTLLRLKEQLDLRRPVSPLGGADLTWFAYSRAMRTLSHAIDTLGHSTGDIALVSEPGCPTLPAAWRLHCARGAARPFVHINAARYASDDLIAALVGDARTVQEPGWLELADGGTLFIENLTALGHDARVVLGSSLQSRSVRRLGAVSPITIELDLIATFALPPGDLDLPSELLFRFAERVLTVPPLRERREDLESLALTSIDRACRTLGRTLVGLDPEALAAIVSYPWPGNLSEFEDAIHRAVRRARGPRVTLDALPPQVRGTVLSTEDPFETPRSHGLDDA